MKTFKACGMILLSPNNEILLLQNAKRGDWGLPKGHMEEAENESQTAFRELQEETGIQAKDLNIDANFKKELTYSFLKKTGQGIIKKALYFLAHCDKKLNVTLSDEHQAYLWATAPQITQKIQYPDLRHLLLECLHG